jgi:hypothetical protein
MRGKSEIGNRKSEIEGGESGIGIRESAEPVAAGFSLLPSGESGVVRVGGRKSEIGNRDRLFSTLIGTPYPPARRFSRAPVRIVMRGEEIAAILMPQAAWRLEDRVSVR